MDEKWAKRACKLCVYWEPRPERNAGLCKAKPPTRKALNDFGSWPFTEPDDWCGKFRYDPTKEEE